jgi:hypothetical protein
MFRETPEPMPLEEEVFRAIGHTVVLGEQQRALIVFENVGSNACGHGISGMKDGDNFFQ